MSNCSRVAIGLLVTICLCIAFALPVQGQSNAQILFTSTRDGHLAKIYLMDADGRNVRRIGNLPGLHGLPRFSRDNQKILFQYSTDIGTNTQIYVMNRDGSNAQALTRGPESHAAPQFTSDDRIVYSRSLPRTVPASPPFVAWYMMNSDGSGSTRFFVDAPGMGRVDDLVRFSLGPRGMLVFAHHVMVENRFIEQLFKISMDGMDLMRLTNSPEANRLASWCASGEKIAFQKIAFDHRRDGIYIMKANGANASRVVAVDFSRIVSRSTGIVFGSSETPVQLLREPSFSRDCGMLAFALNLDGTEQIHVVDVDSSRMRQLTNSPGTSGEPVFSR